MLWRWKLFITKTSKIQKYHFLHHFKLLQEPIAGTVVVFSVYSSHFRNIICDNRLLKGVTSFADFLKTFLDYAMYFAW
jgi:hypothetical protein